MTRDTRSNVVERFDLDRGVALITGGAGLLGARHAEAIATANGIPIILDVDDEAAEGLAAELNARHHCEASAVRADVTRPYEVADAITKLIDRHGRLDILINNAAVNPAPAAEEHDVEPSRLESFEIERWDAELDVGLKGAFLCSRAAGAEMAKRGGGVILNIASDLAVIAPDQRLYRLEGVPEQRQPVKPITYSVIKAGLIGMTRYLATYWAHAGVRVNSLSPGGIHDAQPDWFVSRLERLIPMGRMAEPNEYEAAVVFLCSTASSYMTGQNLVIDGGRTCW